MWAAHEVARLAAELGQEVRLAEERADERAEELRQLSQESDELRRLISLDDLTLLLNRREFLKRFVAEIVRSRRHGHELALVIVDIDDFKSVNDTYGHAAGDEVLRHLGGFLQTEIRQSDVGARVGGDEFVVLLPETDLEGAINSAEKLRFGIAESSKGWAKKCPASPSAWAWSTPDSTRPPSTKASSSIRRTSACTRQSATAETARGMPPSSGRLQSDGVARAEQAAHPSPSRFRS